MNGQTDPWEDWLQDLRDVVWRSRWNGKSGKGDTDDAIQSAIKSALRQEDCPEHDDPAIYDLIEEQLKRKIDTYRHAYRTGDGRTLRISQIGDREGDLPIELLTQLKAVCGDDGLETPPAEITSRLSHQLVDEYLKWVNQQVQSFDAQVVRDVFDLWLDGASIREMQQRLGLSQYDVKRYRRMIKQELRQRAGQ